MKHFGFIAASSLVLLTALQVAGQERASGTPPGNWSAVIDGVRGRLIATPVQDARGPQVQIELELQSLNTEREIWWTDFEPTLRFSLEEESGPVKTEFRPGGNRAVMPGRWLVLPAGSTLRMTVTHAAFEYVTVQNKVMFRPTVFQGWWMPQPRTSNLYISASFKPEQPNERRRWQWLGPLTLPRVSLP